MNKKFPGYCHPINGSYVVSDIIGGQLVTRVYYGYTKRECQRMFRAEFKSKRIS